MQANRVAGQNVLTGQKTCHAMACRGMHGTACHAMAWHGMPWHALACHGLPWHAIACQDTGPLNTAALGLSCYPIGSHCKPRLLISAHFLS